MTDSTTNYPKLRNIEAHPYRHEGQDMVLLRDTECITENSLLVPKQTIYIISMMDGTRTPRDIQAEYMRATGDLIYIEQIENLIDIMDKNLLLANDNFNRQLSILKASYEKNPIREPFLAGKSYPSNRMELLISLDEMLKDGRGNKNEGKITGLLAPHIDYSRGGEVYSATYSHLHNMGKTLLIIFGTSHRLTEKIWNISIKDFLTPLDTVPNSKEFCRLIKENALLRRYIDEWPHRSEHSIELQLPIMQFTIHDDFEILPILTGSMHEFIEGTKDLKTDYELADIIGNFRMILEQYGRSNIIVAGADLAHIGEQFGDRYALDFSTLNISKTKDEELLGYIANVDAEGFFETVRKERDRRKICGLAPIYFQLKFLEGSICKISGYKQWTDGRSSVSFAGGVFYSKNN
ncbi:MAG: hypothetical protein BWX58_00607 [Deltaproteobacteria bacterium ADurb.Bin026]|jgi:hypothetical protein|nr:hypothetical protein [Syntrophorhabdaceae bacterium]OQC49863.1 MAG: hypothetical protein BWX58_00607 [Deltaproteobacteria bacterium ADurb.Bin026]HNZ58712.1 AmmeMemoRadiSam system protein B [Syntrophorhabdaceae bacterium]